MSERHLFSRCTRCQLVFAADHSFRRRTVELLIWSALLVSFLLVGALAPITLVGLAPVFLAAAGGAGWAHEQATQPQCPRCG